MARVPSPSLISFPCSWRTPRSREAAQAILWLAVLFAAAGSTGVAVAADASPEKTPGAVIVKLVDCFGQPLQKSFPGKIADEEELKKDIDADKAYYASLNPPPSDIYGGLPGSQAKYGLKKTGYFHIERAAGRFVMVDPLGNVFFENGLCPMAPIADYTLIGGRRDAFEWIPEVKSEFKTAFQNSSYAQVFSFYRANMVRKYGKPFDDEEQTGIATMRMRKWGFSAQGAFGGETQTMAAMNLPYMAIIGTGLPALPGKTKLPDVFVDGAEQKIDETYAKRVAPKATDPLLIGYYLGNEQHFEDLPQLIPSLKGSVVGTKRRLVRMLQDKYKDIAAFNKAWNPQTPAGSFDELLDVSLAVVTQQAADDMRDFQDLYTDAFYGMIARAFHKYDPNHLLLGSRWQPSTANSQILLKNAGKYMDVISVNYYTYGIERDFLKRIHEVTGRPILTSEWHYTASRDSAPRSGVKEVSTQTERGLAYRNYVETVASLPYVVGQEWFSYLDQPVTGRHFEGYNGEAGNIGLVSVTDRPYKAALAEMMKTNYDIYAVMFGGRKPFEYDDPRFKSGPGMGRKEVNAAIALPGMKIDAPAADCPGRPGEHLSKQNLVLGSDAGSLEADFKVCWDAERLYVYVQIADATPMINAGTGANLWNGDGIELFIGSDAIDEAGELKFTDRHLFIGGSKQTGAVRTYIMGAPTTAAIEAEVVANAGGSGYSIEAAIPWEILNTKPAEGKTLLFDIAVDDNAGHGRVCQLMWNGIARNGADRGKWGLIHLTR